MARKVASSAVAAAFLLFLPAPRAAAQHVHAAQDELSDANITVRVFGADGKPFGKQAFVTLYQQGSSMPLGTVMTSVSSTAVLTGMPGYGPYTVEVKADGYEPERKDFEFNAASGRVEVEVKMRPPPGASPPPGPPPRDPKVQGEVDQALKAMQAGKFQDAQKELTAAHKSAPQDADVCYLLGAAYQKGGDLRSAQTYLGKAISIDPDNVRALVALGQVYDQQKDYKAAIPPLERAVIVDAKEWLAHWVLSDAYLRTGEYEKARKNAEAAVELGDGAATKAELIEGQALVQLGRPEDAIRVLEDFLHNLPNDPSAPAVRAYIAKLQSAASVPARKSSNH